MNTCFIFCCKVYARMRKKRIRIEEIGKRG